MLQAYHILNIEGLVLSNVPDGTYELIALPLRLVGCDASPLRAVLRPVQHVNEASEARAAKN